MADDGCDRSIKHVYKVEDTKGDKITYYDDDILFVDNIKEIDEHPDFKTLTNLIIICVKGRMQLEINGRNIAVCEKELLICPPQTMVGHSVASPDYECKILCMTDRIIQNLLRSYVSVWNRAVYVDKLNVRKLNECDLMFYLKFYELAKMCIDMGHPSKYKKDILTSLLQAGMLVLCRLLEQGMDGKTKPSRSQTDNTFRKFLDMLNSDGTSRHSVSHYSKKLCITPKYLSMICSKHSGKTAKQWINDFLLEKVHYYLRSTDMPIKEISGILGFPTPSSMGRYVKEHFGMAPLAYRNSDIAE